jgi:hypothetical protein
MYPFPLFSVSLQVGINHFKVTCIMKKTVLYILNFIFILGFSQSIFGQGNTISSENHGANYSAGDTIYYCFGDAVDTYTAVNPPLSAYAGAGITNLGGNPAQATFDPNVNGGAATWNITYNGKIYVIVVNDGTANLAPLDTVCSYDAPFNLTGGTPTGGTYYVDGVVSTAFDPSVGAGTYQVVYEVGTAGCIGADGPEPIVVTGVNIDLLPLPGLCEDDGPVDISAYGTPAGGVFSGTGITDPSGIFDPTGLNGTYAITYTIDSAACTFTDVENQVVNPLPIVTISNLDAVHCEDDVLDDDFDYTPASSTGTGIFSGVPAGITDIGDGTAIYDPNSTGLGSFVLEYTFTDINGCTNSTTFNTKTGTEIYFVDLDATYCENEGTFQFQYTPWPGVLANGDTVTCVNSSGTPVGGTAFINNGDGTANFNPSAAGNSTYTFTFQYTDTDGCINIITQDVLVSSAPIANIGGLSSAYCSNGADITITGTPVPVAPAKGVFSALIAGLTDNGDGTAVFSPSTAPVGGPYDIIYKYTNGAGCMDYDTNQVTINQAPSATISGTTTICEGNATNLTFDFAGPSTDFSVIYTDGTNNYNVTYSGVATNSFTESVSPTTTTTYRLVSASDASGCAGSVADSAVITVTPTVNITTQPSNKVTCPSDNISFNVVSDGVNLTYAWEFDDGSGGGFVPVGISSASLAINGVSAADAGTYRVTVSSTTCGGPEVSDLVTLDVGNATTITSQPSDVDACDGTSENLQVIASGDNLTYEWRENGVAINTLGDPNYVGDDTPILTINNLDNTYDGNVYTCYVSGDCGDELSNPATLNVDDPIIITTQPTNKTTCPGSNVNYTVAATGTNLSYQWQYNDGAWNDIAGAIGTNLVLNGVDATDSSRTYRCEITSPCGEILYSDDVTLNLYTDINITTQPINDTICETDAVNFQVISGGSGLSYQWQFNDGSGYSDINDLAGVRTGTTSSSLTLLTTALADEGVYRCVITNVCGTVNSDAAELIVDEAAIIITEPVDVNGCAGDDINFVLTATGTNLIYQWQYELAGVYTDLVSGAHISGSGTLVSGVNNPTLNIDGVAAADAGNYRCLVTNGCGTVMSSTATLILHDATVLNPAFPTDKNKCIGETANFSVDVTSGSINTYRWQFDDGSGYSFLSDGLQPSGANIPVGSSNSNSLSITNLFAADAGLYRCEVVGVCGTVYSDVANLDIDEPVSITVNPVDKMACETEDVTFSVAATGTGLTYQWWETNGAAADAMILAAVNPNLVLTNVDASYEDDYYCVVSNSCNSRNSGSANLTLYNPIVIDSDPANISRCEGGDASFNITVDPTSDDPAYQWYQDGNPLTDGLNGNGATVSGAKTNSLFISGITTGEEGVYTCEVNGPCNAESRTASLTVSDSIIINTNPTSKLACPVTNTSFIVNASGDITNYQWQYDDLGGGGFVDLANVAPYSGVTTSTLIITNLVASEEGVYRCEITGSCIGDIVYSNSANLTVGVNTAITAQPTDVTGCESQDIDFSLTATGTGLTYQWYKNPADIQVDGGDISGATTNTLSIANIDLADAGVYYCIVSGTCGNVTSGNPSLTVNERLTINTNPVSKTICEGSNTSYVVNVSGDLEAVPYQWQYNDGGGFIPLANGAHPTGASTVSGATTNTLNLTGVGSGDAGTYRCVIDGVCENQNSSPAGLTVATNTAIVTPPSDAGLCEGDEAIFSVDATGTGLTYEWYKASQAAPLANGGDVSGATTNTLTLSNLTVTDADVYNCLVSGFCTAETSPGANLDISEHVTISSQPANKSACPGGATSFNVTASGDIVSYQWYKDGVDISTLGDPNFVNDNTPTLNIINLTAAYAGDYRCEITGDCETVNSNTATLTVNVTTTSTDPSNVADCEGETVSFSVTTTGTNLNYQWYKNGVPVVDAGQASGSIFSGATSSTLIIDNAKPGDNGSFHCFVDGQCTDITTNTATLNISPATAVTLQPSDIAVVDGGAATFTITAEGDIDSYQWYKDGTPLGVAANIAAVDQPTLTIDPVTYGADEGDYHCVVISAACGNAVSNTATLTILPSTYITGQPTNKTKCEGEDVVLSITTSGGPHTYEWQFDDGFGYTALVDDGHISGSSSTVSGVTTTSLVITGIQPADQGFYRCVLNGGSDLSNSALVTVNESITIVSNPLDKQRCLGDPVTFSVSATGAIDTYQWEFDSDVTAPGTWVNVGGNSSSYTIPAVAAGDAGNYRCVIQALGTCANKTSSSAALTVNSPTVLNSGPVGQPICEGASVTLPVDASGSNLTYQWYFNSAPLADGGSITGSQEKDLVLSNVLTTDAGNYYCEIVGSCGTETTVPVDITVDEATNIVTQPISRNKCVGDQVQFVVVAEGTNLSYQWYYNGVSMAPAGQNSILTIDPIAAGNEGNYYCEITSGNGCGDITSNMATLTVYEPTVLGLSPSDELLCEGESTTLTANVTGGNLTYIWIRDNDTLTNSSNISGVNTANLVITNATLSEDGNYWCSISGFCGATVLTNSATITVDPTTNITAQPIEGEICEGDSKLFIVEADGINLNYQWRFNGGDIVGETNSQLIIDPVTLGDDGDYTCLVSSANGCGDVLTTPATLTVHESTAINVHPADDTKCEGNSITLSVDATGGNLQYQWIKDGVTVLTDGGNLSGTNTKDLLITGVTLADDGVYTCEVSGFCNDLTSDPADLTVNPNVVITSSPVSKTKCLGTSVTFYATATGSNLTYQWQKGTTDLNPGAQPSGSTVSNETTSALTITNLAVADAGSYRCVVTGDCGFQNSDPAILNMNDSTLITTQPAGGSYCEGDEVTLNLASSGDNLTYQWKKDGVAISDTGSFAGTQTATLIISSASTNYTGVYSCLVSGSCGSENSSTVNINIDPETVITGQPQSKTKCEGDAGVFSVTATGSNLTYQWQKDGTLLPDGGTISGATTPVLNISNTVDTDDGTYRCIVTGDCGTVNSDAANLIVNVYPDPAGAITGPTSICQGTSNVIYEVNAIPNADYYIWSLPVGVNIISGDSTRLIEVEFDTNELGGNIAVRGLNSCGYGTASPILNVIAHPIPSAQAGIDQSLCVDNTNLTAANPGTATGTWNVVDGPAIVQKINLNTSYIHNLREGTNTLTWEVEENGCSSIDTVVIFNNHVAVEAGTGQPICSTSITLDGSAVPTGANGSWSVIAGSASLIDGTNPNTIASDFASGLNVLKWTVTKGGCSNYDTVIINNQRPTLAYAGIDQSICKDSTVLNANVSAIGEGLWSVIVGAATFENDTLQNTKVTGLSKGDNVLRWTISNGICSTSDDVKITNNQMIINAGDDQVICSNTTTLDAVNPPSGNTYWAVDTGSAIFVENDLYNTVVTGLAKGTNILTWNVNNNGCISSDTISIINDSPTKANAGADTIVEVDYATLQGNIPSTGTGVWSLISGSAVINNPSQYNSNVTALAFGDNIFRWTITNNSCISTDDVIINNNNPTDVNAGTDQTICSSETSLEGSQPKYYGQWSVVKGSAIFANPDEPITLVTSLAKGENILRWSVWQNGWTYDDVVISNDSPTAANAGTNRVLCTDSVYLSANNPIIGSGKWTVISGSGQFENDTIYNTKTTNLAQGENIFKWTITNKSCSSDDLVKVTNNSPTEAYAGSDQPICTNTVTLNPNTPSIGTGEWSVISGAANFNGNEVTYLAPDTNIFRWTIVNNVCSSYDEITIVNNEPSNANAGANKTICYDSISLSANIPVKGTAIWTIQSGSGNIGDVYDATTDATNLNQGINVFRWTITYNGCTKFDEVNINNALVEATTGVDQEICSNSTVLEANNPESGTGLWSVVGGSGSAFFESASQPDTRVDGLDKGQNILRWTITNEICVSYSDVIITNNLPTEASAGPDQSLCTNSTVLQGSNPTIGTGEWSVLSGSATISDASSPSSNISNLSYGVNTLRWTITNGGCISSDEVVISNNSTEISNAGNDQSICADSTILYANAPNLGIGQWSVISGSATFENNNQYNTKVRSLGKGTNILKWVISNDGCSSNDEVTVTNNSPTKAIAGANLTICGDHTFLQANVPSIGTGEWSLISGAANFTDKTNYNTEVTGLNPGNNTLRWTIENQGCTSSDDIQIYNDLPFKADAGTDFEICSSTTSLFANDPTSGVGEWTVISGSATFYDSSKYDAVVSNLGFGANTLRWTITYDACTTYDEVIVTNNKLKVNAGVDQTVVESSTLLAASNPSSGSGYWFVKGGSGIFASSNNAITMVSNLGSGLNTFRWSVDVNSCISYDDVSITYNVPPTASFVITASKGCPPLDVYFVNNSLDGLPFTWNFDDGTTSNQITIKHTYTDPGIYKPSLTIIGGNGEVIVQDTLIEVYPQPSASFLIVNTQVYIPEEEAIFINQSTDALTYQWEFGDGGTSTEFEPKYVYETEGVYDIILHAWSDNNCYDSTKVVGGVEVFESGGIVFPTAFTPNLSEPSGGYYNPNDFSNDVFYPIGKGLENYHLEIFNKWGILVFESNDINIG